MNTRSLYRQVNGVLESIIYVSCINARRAVLSLIAKGLSRTMENRIFIDAKVYRPYFWVHSLFVFSKIFMLIFIYTCKFGSNQSQCINQNCSWLIMELDNLTHSGITDDLMEKWNFCFSFPLRKDDTYKWKAIKIKMMIFLQSRARSIWFPWRCSTNTEEAPSLSWRPPHWVRRNVIIITLVLNRGFSPYFIVLISSRIYQKSEFFVIVHARVQYHDRLPKKDILTLTFEKFNYFHFFKKYLSP